MFVNHNLTTNLFFVNQLDIHAKKLILALRSHYNNALFSLRCKVARTFHQEITIPIRRCLSIDDYKGICFRLIKE